MDIADSCFTMIMECHLWQCTGNTALIIWSADTMTFTGCRCQTLHPSCMPTHLLLKYGKIGNESKTLQYLMGHSDISVTMNVYTHIGFDDAEEELKRMEEFRKAQAEVEQKKEKTMSQKMFKVV